ncbi:hypothetical protein J4209_05055 [Candidatus Woesearchaeota archaeon]|nr:hypothetical protein [Candidatus Woesearchaeota archaeon]
MALFGKKKRDEDIGETGAESFPSMSDDLPVDQIMGLKQQGLSDDQIMQSLQQQGYTSSQISDAMAQADISGQLSPEGEEMMEEEAQPSPMEEPPQMEGPTQSLSLGEKDRVEEIAEAIIDEKWNELLQDINKVVEWKERTEARITRLEQEMRDVKSSFDSLHKGILGKISEYDQNLVNVGTEIKAMEKVFQKILPTFTENVNRLSRITQSRVK